MLGPGSSVLPDSQEATALPSEPSALVCRTPEFHQQVVSTAAVRGSSLCPPPPALAPSPKAHLRGCVTAQECSPSARQPPSSPHAPRAPSPRPLAVPSPRRPRPSTRPSRARHAKYNPTRSSRFSRLRGPPGRDAPDRALHGAHFDPGRQGSLVAHQRGQRAGDCQGLGSRPDGGRHGCRHVRGCAFVTCRVRLPALHADLAPLDPPAGPGGLTRAFLDLPNVKRVIAIEDAYRYLPFLDVRAHRFCSLRTTLR